MWYFCPSESTLADRRTFFRVFFLRCIGFFEDWKIQPVETLLKLDCLVDGISKFWTSTSGKPSHYSVDTRKLNLSQVGVISPICNSQSCNIVNKGYYMQSATYAVIYSHFFCVVTNERVSIKHRQRVNIYNSVSRTFHVAFCLLYVSQESGLYHSLARSLAR